MNRIRIEGIALVFRVGDDQLVTDSKILGHLADFAYEDERFTDYIGGPAAENDLLATLNPSGYLRFEYDGSSSHLVAITEYESNRPLNDRELELLVTYTMGQWSDGIGENLSCLRPRGIDVSVQCQTEESPKVSQFRRGENIG